EDRGTRLEHEVLELCHAWPARSRSGPRAARVSRRALPQRLSAALRREVYGAHTPGEELTCANRSSYARRIVTDDVRCAARMGDAGSRDAQTRGTLVRGQSGEALVRGQSGEAPVCGRTGELSNSIRWKAQSRDGKN